LRLRALESLGIIRYMRPFTRTASNRRVTLCTSAVGAVCAVALAAFAAPAGATWLSAVDLSPTTGIDAQQVRVAMDRRGDAVAVWQAFNGTETAVQVSIRPVSTGVWSTPAVLTTEGNGIKEPSVAMGEKGAVAVIWQVESGLTSVVQAAVKPAGSAVWNIESISSGGEEASQPSIAIDAHGNAVAVWQRYTETLLLRRYAVESSVRFAGGEWQAPVQLSSEGASAEEPTVAANPGGDALAAWQGLEGSESISIVQASVRPVSTGAWSAAATVSIPAEAEANALATLAGIDAHGNTTVSWIREDVLKSATRLAATGVWGGPVDVSAGGEQVISHSLAVSSHEALAVWTGGSGSMNIVESASRAKAGASWHAPVRILTAPTGKSPAVPDVAINRDGGAVAVWVLDSGRFGAFKGFVQSSVRPEAAAAWAEPVALTAEAENARVPQVATSLPGDAVAAWELVHGSSENVIQSAYYEP
jgi:hypothetical protein